MEDNNVKTQKAPLIYAIIGVAVLIVAVAGSTFAFYSATVSSRAGEVTGEAGGGALPTLTVTKITTAANDKLIPIDMTTAMLTNAAKGYGNTGSTFDATKSCKDKNGYSVCQIYSVTVKNNSDVTMAYNISLTTLSGTNTPNIDAVTMGTSNLAVSNIASLVKDTDGTTLDSSDGDTAKKLICTTNEVALNGTTTTCYFMVFIKNLNQAQTDNGTFNGTVTATSTTGAEVKAQF